MNETLYLEGMTSISAVIQSIRSGLSDRKIQEIWIDEDKKQSKSKEIGFLHAVSVELGFSIRYCPASAIDTVVDGNTHGGIIAKVSERTLPLLNDCIKDTSSLPAWLNHRFLAMLDGIEDPYNFGYCVRSLYAAGVDGIIIPPRNWMSAAGVVARASAGTTELLPMAVAEGAEAAKALKQIGYRVVCAGIRDSVPLYEANLKKPLLLVIGGEKRGISRSVLDLADETVRIDYGRPFRGSLTASGATAVLAFEVLHQNAESMGKM